MIVPGEKDVASLINFQVADYEHWLRTGFEGYLLEDAGVWAFDPLAVFIGQQDHLVLDLEKIFEALPSQKRGYFRQAIANNLANIEENLDIVVIFEHLLSLAAVTSAGSEISRVLPQRIGNGFFGLSKTQKGKNLFELTIMTVAELSTPIIDSDGSNTFIKCIHALIGSKHFERAYAGLALIALCRADAWNLSDHMKLLRSPLHAMFRDYYETDDISKRLLTEEVLNRVGFKLVVETFPDLICSELQRYVATRSRFSCCFHWLFLVDREPRVSPRVS